MSDAQCCRQRRPGTDRVFEGSISNDTPHHDFVCANLTLDTITPVLLTLFEISNHTVLLSGVLGEQEAAITNELSKFEISNLKFEYAGE
jgi:ribosomal protein L11 methylase PrmA